MLNLNILRTPPEVGYCTSNNNNNKSLICFIYVERWDESRMTRSTREPRESSSRGREINSIEEREEKFRVKFLIRVFIEYVPSLLSTCPKMDGT